MIDCKVPVAAVTVSGGERELESGHQGTVDRTADLQDGVVVGGGEVEVRRESSGTAQSALSQARAPLEYQRSVCEKTQLGEEPERVWSCATSRSAASYVSARPAPCRPTRARVSDGPATSGFSTRTLQRRNEVIHDAERRCPYGLRSLTKLHLRHVRHRSPSQQRNAIVVATAAVQQIGGALPR